MKTKIKIGKFVVGLNSGETFRCPELYRWIKRRRFRTMRQAENYIESLNNTVYKDSVFKGDFYLDAPEEWLSKR